MVHDELLREHGFIILNNLRQFNKNPEMIFELMNYLPNSELTLLLPIFQIAKQYFDTNQEFPTGRYFLSTPVEPLFQYNPKPYTEDIYRDVYRRLKLQHVALKSINEITQGNLEVAISTLSEISNIRSNKKEPLNFDDYVKFYEESENKGIGLVTGITELDEILKGYDYGSLNVIAAPASSGKTTFGVSAVYNAVINENKNFVFFSLEVMDTHVYYSFLSRHSRELGFPIQASDIKKHKLNKQQKMWYAEVGEDFNRRAKNKLFIVTQDDFVNFSATEIEKMIYKFDAICRERGETLDGFVFDYLQLTKYYKPPTIKDEKETMNYYTRYLLELATNFNGTGLIGILLAQLNRTGAEQLKKNKDASLFSFAEANELERSAHTAVVLYSSDDMKMAGNINFYVVKNRIGSTKSTPTTVVCDFPYFKIGTTPLANMFNPDNDYLLDTSMAQEKLDDIQSHLDGLDALL